MRETDARTESGASFSKSPTPNIGTVGWKFKQGVRPPPGYVGPGDAPAVAKIQSSWSQSNAAPQPAMSTTGCCSMSPFDGPACQRLLEPSSRSSLCTCRKSPSTAVPQLASSVSNDQHPRFVNTFAPVTSTDANKCQMGPNSPGCCQLPQNYVQWFDIWSKLTASTGCPNSGQGGKLVPDCASRFVGSQPDSANDSDRASASSAEPKPPGFCSNSAKFGFGAKSSSFSMQCLKSGPTCKQPINAGQTATSCAKTLSPIGSQSPKSSPAAKLMAKGASVGLNTRINSALNSPKSTSTRVSAVNARPAVYGNNSGRQTGAVSAPKKGLKSTLSANGNAAASRAVAVTKVLSLHTNSGVTKTKLGVKRMPTALVTQQVECMRSALRAAVKKHEAKTCETNDEVIEVSDEAFTPEKCESTDEVIEVFDDEFTPKKCEAKKCESSNAVIEVFDEPSTASASTPSVHETQQTQPEEMETSEAVSEVFLPSVSPLLHFHLTLLSRLHLIMHQTI